MEPILHVDTSFDTWVRGVMGPNGAERLLQGWLFFQLWVAPHLVPLGRGNAQV